jgi:nucleoside-diphosphate-sugar epimerase
VPYICLRLPDVIGPFDNTERFWCYLTWLKYQNKYPIPISYAEENNKLSFVYSKDVVSQIIKLIEMKDIKSKEYNLCF